MNAKIREVFGQIFKQTLGSVLAAALFALAPGWAFAQGTGGPIRLIFPFAAGGGGDGTARFLAEELRKVLGESVIVENRAGADGRVGVRAVVTAPPDGRTLLITPFGPITIHPSVYPNLSYDPLKDLQPISQVARIEFAMSTRPMTPAKNLRELVAWMRVNPDKASFASPGAGTIPHFSGILFSTEAGIDLRHVPYRGTAPSLTDLVGGQIALASTPASDAGELHKAGKIRMLATSGAERSPFSPDVATYKEQGFNIEAEGWYGVYAPAGTPMAIVDRYAKIIADAVRSPAGRELLERFRLVATGTTPAELARIQKADFERWGPPIKASGFKPDE